MDGYFAGPDGEMDWHCKNWTADMDRLLCEQIIKAETIVMGRITYIQMASRCTELVQDLHVPRQDYTLLSLINGCTKIVFSKTTGLPVWENCRVITTPAEMELKRMKKERGKNMIILGSGLLVQSLLNAGIIDELILWIHPVVLKKGRLLFTTMSDDFLLSLIRTEQTDSGVMVLFYEVVQFRSEKTTIQALRLHSHF